MEQRRFRLPVAERSGLRARIVSTGGLLAVAAMVLFVLVLLYPKRTLIEQLRDEPRNDPLSVSYLGNLLKSDPDNAELRLLLAERQFALKQHGAADVSLAPLLQAREASPLRRRAQLLALRLLEQYANAGPPGSREALGRRAELRQALADKLDEAGWTAADLVRFARQSAGLNEPHLARRFYLRLFDLPGQPGASESAWFDDAVRNALGTQDYLGAAALHQRAMMDGSDAASRRAHLLQALRILQSGNLLDEALQVATTHAAAVGSDAELLMFLTRLALAANRPPAAEAYAKRLLRMGSLALPRAWFERLLDIVPSAHADDAPQAGDPRLPFDEVPYLLAYNTFLANRNLADAHRVAASAVRQVPEATAWRERLAQSAEWQGRPQLALEHWRWLAEHSDSADALRAVLRLAPGLNEDGALLAAWRKIATQRRLNTAEALLVVALHERMGQPREGAAWLEQLDRSRPDPALLEALAGLHERLGDVPTSVRTLGRLIAREGATPARALRLASLHSAMGDFAQAYAALAPVSPRATDADSDYWRMLGDLAWTLQNEPVALQALQRRARGPVFEAEDADRLLALMRKKHPAEAARLAEAAWRRLDLPGYLVGALEMWWNLRDLAQMQRVFDSLAADDERRVGTDPYFWLLRAQWQRERGRPDAAVADMRRAGALSSSAETRSALVFLLIELGQTDALAGELAAHQETALFDPAYDAAWGAGWLTLGQAPRALLHWRRQASRHATDAPWLASYADALQGAGLARDGELVRRRAWRLGRDRLAAANVGAGAGADATALQLFVARMTVAHAPADQGLAVLRHLLRQDSGASGNEALDAAVSELLLGWGLNHDRHEQARHWLALRYGRKLAQPGVAELSLALARRDLPVVQQVLLREGKALPVALRVEAETALDHRAVAQTLAAESLDRQDDDGLHQAFTGLAWPDARKLQVGIDSLAGDLRGQQFTLGASAQAGEGLRLTPLLSHARQRSADPAVLTGVPGSDTALGLGARLALGQDAVDASIGVRRAFASFATGAIGLRLRPTPDVTARVEFGYHERATESSPLRVAGVKDELRLSADWAIAPGLSVRAAGQATRFSLQGGGKLGSGSGLDWSVSQSLRQGTPDLALRAFGSYRNYTPTSAPLDPRSARLNPAGTVPDASFFIPRSYSMHGIGLSTGAALPDSYQRAWRPFADVALTRHSVQGSGASLGFGLVGSVLGSDQLMLRGNLVRGGAAGSSGGNAGSLGVQYSTHF